MHKYGESKSNRIGKPLRTRLDGGTGMYVQTNIISQSCNQRDKLRTRALRSLQIGIWLWPRRLWESQMNPRHKAFIGRTQSACSYRALYQGSREFLAVRVGVQILRIWNRLCKLHSRYKKQRERNDLMKVFVLSLRNRCTCARNPQVGRAQKTGASDSQLTREHAIIVIAQRAEQASQGP
jgi:hypothetical protein